MKMTGLEWRYLQRIALDHPYFDTHKLPLTEKEAKAIVEANITMTGREFVDSIYAKLGMTRPKEDKKRFVWLRSISELFTVPPIRKIAIAVLVIVLMTVFFAATPTGRAIAESVLQYIATLFEDGRLVMKQSDNETPLFFIDSENEVTKSEQQNDEASYVYVKSFDAFSEVTGKTPVKLPLQYSEIYYVFDKEIDYLELHSTYITQRGRIVTYQIWDVPDTFSFTLTGYMIYDENDGIYYSIEKNGSIYCKRVLKDSIITVSSDGSYSLTDLVEMIKNG